jgi:SAM-dependent methyltransferase
LIDEFAWEKTMVREKERRDREFAPLVGKARRSIAGVRRGVRGLMKRNKTAELSRRFFAPGPVLDVGCGNGGLIASLPAGAVPWGIELSAGLAREARSRFEASGGKVIEADALGGLKQCDDDYFTGVLARSFLEHETRPFEVLAEIRRVLRPGGALILKMPNYGCLNRRVRGDQWCGYRFPDHVNYFTPAHLERLLERAGLRILRFAFRDRFPTSDNMWCVAAAP